MAIGLLDLVRPKEIVKIGDTEVEIVGVSVEALAYLAKRYSVIADILAEKEIGFEKALDMGADALASFIAAGCGMAGNAQAEAVVAGLALDAQTDLFVAVMHLTLPGGKGPFLEKLARLGPVQKVPSPPIDEDPATS